MNRLNDTTKSKKSSATLIHALMLTAVLSLFAFVGVEKSVADYCDGTEVACDVGSETCSVNGFYCKSLKQQFESQSGSCQNNAIDETGMCGFEYSQPGGQPWTNCTTEDQICGHTAADTSCESN